eukprot:CAMPEP_0184542302 /NCGR_PEP_ID=MMETSP0199_2-20130426/1890_1 /TAXON_ID=1112570 /ORGANISM="Thraustochytrium sp., Strain LLF1b" /LENGTH=1285 /DNA_ID=CAMNT_0026936075 /DNA_START=170 /DNA_END=4027 /DNA_ORIENTATION=+
MGVVSRALGAVAAACAWRGALGVLTWDEVHRRVLEAHGPGEMGEVVDVAVELSKDGELMTVEFEAFGHGHKLELELDTKLFAPEYAHDLVNIEAGTTQRVKEHKECLFRHVGTTLALVSTCGQGFSATLDSAARADQVRLELAGGKFSLPPGARVTVKCLAYDTGANIDDHWSCGADAKEYGHAGGEHGHEHQHHHNHDHNHNQTHNHEHQHTHETHQGHSSYQVVEEGDPYGTERTSLSSQARKLAQKTKFIKILIVNDEARYKLHKDNTHALSATILNHVRHVLLASFNEMSEYFLDLQVVHMISFSHGDPWGTPSKNSEGEIDEKSLLSAFSTWRGEQIASDSGIPDHGVAHLFSGSTFTASVVGLANVRALCHNVAGTGVVQAIGFTMETIATIMAHELMHNLGAFHTTDSAKGSLVPEPCGSGNRDFIMSPAGIKETSWSTCTANWIKMSFEEKAYPTGCRSGSCTVQPTYGVYYPACAETKSKEWTLASMCGNGIREPGEECDCGEEDCSDIDPCCDGNTCKLKEAATCSADEACCDKATCQPVKKSENKVCREVEDNSLGCDIEEYCDGTSGVCPKNEIASPGTSCGETGACYAGRCQSHEEQCLQFGREPCPDKNHDDKAEGCGVLHCLSRTDSSKCEAVDWTVEDGTPCAGNVNAGTGKRKLCRSNRCISSELLELPIHVTCSNGVLDPFETDIDCGGPNCLPCLPRESCLIDTDCFSTATQAGKCDKDLPPTGAPTEREYFQKTVGVSCGNYETSDLCGDVSGCIWLDKFSKCKDTDYFPPSSGCSIEDESSVSNKCCSSQKKEASCINWMMCQWEDDGAEGDGKCRLVATKSPTISYEEQYADVPGTCREHVGVAGEEQTPVSYFDSFGSVVKIIMENPLIALAMFAGCIAVGVVIGFYTCHKEMKGRKTRRVVIRPSSRRGSKTSRTSRASSASTRASSASTISGASGSPTASSMAAYTGTAASPPVFVLRSCPSCHVHYSNPSNPGGLCNACNGKVARANSLSNFGGSQRSSQGSTSPLRTTSTASSNAPTATRVPSPVRTAAGAPSPVRVASRVPSPSRTAAPAAAVATGAVTSHTPSIRTAIPAAQPAAGISASQSPPMAVAVSSSQGTATASPSQTYSSTRNSGSSASSYSFAASTAATAPLLPTSTSAMAPPAPATLRSAASPAASSSTTAAGPTTPPMSANTSYSFANAPSAPTAPSAPSAPRVVTGTKATKKFTTSTANQGSPTTNSSSTSASSSNGSDGTTNGDTTSGSGTGASAPNNTSSIEKT